MEGPAMLVLSRKRNQVIVIGDGPDAVRLTVLGTKRGQISLGIEAPRELPIYREELLTSPSGPDAPSTEGVDDVAA